MSFTGYKSSSQILEKLLAGFPKLAASSLCVFRNKISFIFFKNIFETHLTNSWDTLKTYQGLHFVGIDGDEYSLSATGDAIDCGYKGRAVKDDRETYYPRMYAVKAVHLLSGLVCGFYQSKYYNEIAGASSILKLLPKNILAVYDRFYLSKKILEGHLTHQSYFICRCKTGSTFKEITNFVTSKNRVTLTIINGVQVRLIKIKNPRSNKDLIFATNLPNKGWGRKKIEEIYQIRWESEVNNRDQALSMNMESFHSKNINGILQELYSSLFLHNILRLEAFKNGGYEISPDTTQTKKTNFKLLVEMSFDWLRCLWLEQVKKFKRTMKTLVVNNIVGRKRFSRQYSREIKYNSKPFKNASLVPRRS